LKRAKGGNKIWWVRTGAPIARGSYKWMHDKKASCWPVELKELFFLFPAPHFVLILIVLSMFALQYYVFFWDSICSYKKHSIFSLTSDCVSTLSKKSVFWDVNVLHWLLDNIRNEQRIEPRVLIEQELSWPSSVSLSTKVHSNYVGGWDTWHDKWGGN
jgi:hypothetical protein